MIVEPYKLRHFQTRSTNASRPISCRGFLLRGLPLDPAVAIGVVGAQRKACCGLASG
jgi:hypothetical protein